MADLNAQAPKFPGSTASCAGRISAEAVPLQISWTVCWQEAVDTGPSGSIAYVFTPTSSDTIWLHSLTASRICNNAFLHTHQILAALPRVGFRLGSLSIWDINAYSLAAAGTKGHCAF